MTLIYLVRHGETDWNRQRRIQGSTDIPLNPTGRAQAGRTGLLLSRRSWDGIASSPLSRARETGTIISAAIGLDPNGVEVIDDLAERRYGAAEGLDQLELSRLFPGETAVPGRESREDVAARVIPALVSLAERYERHEWQQGARRTGGQNEDARPEPDRPAGSRSRDARLIVTTHGGVIRSVLNHVAPPAPFHRGIPITNGSIHSFRHSDGELELVLFDDPIDGESVTDDCGDLDYQNAVERREAGA